MHTHEVLMNRCKQLPFPIMSLQSRLGPHVLLQGTNILKQVPGVGSAANRDTNICFPTMVWAHMVFPYLGKVRHSHWSCPSPA